MNFVIMCCPGREVMVAELRERLAPHMVLEVWDAQREGNIPCALRAFDLGLSAFGGKPFTVLQDDVEVCQSFGAYVDELTSEPSGRGAPIQWYAHPWVTDATFNIAAPADNRAMKVRAGKTFLVSVATTYSKLWAERIRSYLADCVDGRVPRFMKDDRGAMHGDDAAIAEVLDYYRASYFVHVPSLVQHIGEVSAIAGRKVSLGSHDARQSRCYVGKSFDARELLKLPLWVEDTNTEDPTPVDRPVVIPEPK